MTIDMRRKEDRENGKRHRAFIDGIEITHRCFYASEEDGVAHCYIMVPRGFDSRQHLSMLHGATPKPKPNAFLQGGVWAETLVGYVELKKVA